MLQSTIFLIAWQDHLGIILMVAMFAFAGVSWVVNQIREAQAKQKAKYSQARAQMPDASRSGDGADRRRQKLQELARHRQQQVQEASGQRQANAQRSQQMRQQQTQQTQRTQTQRAQAQQARMGGAQSPAQRPQPPRQAQRPVQQPAQRPTQRPAQRPATPQAAPARRQQPQPQAPQRQAAPPQRARASRASSEEVIELIEIGKPRKLLGVPLQKAFILKEILDKPVAMRDATNSPNLGG